MRCGVRHSEPSDRLGCGQSRILFQPSGSDSIKAFYEVGHSGEGCAFLITKDPATKCYCQDFQRIASRQVTNSEYLEFMRDGGYRKPELWLSDGWDAVNSQQWNAPLYWEERDGNWLEFTFAGMREIDPAAPVCHVSYYEADAFARWSGSRLPREEEWEVASLQAGMKHARRVFGCRQVFNLSLRRVKPRSGLEMCGNGPRVPTLVIPGFVPAAGLVGEYNGKFMCNQFVLRGGSCATPRSHIRATYRNFFPPHARWQFMGIRLAK